MKLLFVFVTMALACGTAADSVVTEFLSSIDPKFEDQHSFLSGHRDQPYFKDVDFIDLDTFATFPVHPSPSQIPLRIAVDQGANVYRLFNFDTLQYNDLVARVPLALSAEEIRPYGQFYLDVTQLWDPLGHTYFTSTESFIAENQRRMKDAESGSSQYGRKDIGRWNTLEVQVRAMFVGFEWNRMVWRDRDSVYEADYMVWMECTGALRHFRLMIHPDGRCDVAKDSLWSESFGYYRKFVR